MVPLDPEFGPYVTITSPDGPTAISPKLTPAGCGGTAEENALTAPTPETPAPDTQVPPWLEKVTQTLPGCPPLPGPTVTVGWSPSTGEFGFGRKIEVPVPVGEWKVAPPSVLNAKET